MANWKCKIDISRYIEEYDGDNLKQTKSKIIEELRKCEDFRKNTGKDLVEILDEMEDEESFDDMLNVIYDFADERKIWLGLQG